ncbi:MAG: hypothetical protein QM808_13120 [Steroidobacteraceae bacterium]
MNIKIAALLALLAGGSAVAADMTPILSNGPGRSEREEYANKALGLLFHRTLFSEGDPQLAADLIMSANFINHDKDEAAGGENFAQFFLNPEKFKNPTPNRSSGPHTADANALTRLYSVTDGDITMMGYAGMGAGDPGARFGSNMFETKQGRVTQWWWSGPTNTDMPAMTEGMNAGAAAGGMAAGGAPGAAPGAAPGGAPGAAPGGAAPGAAGGMAAGAPASTPTDFTKFYPEKGITIVGMPMVINNGKASRAERDANKKLVSEFFDEFFNKKNYAVASKYLADNLINHSENQPAGKDFAAYAQKNQDKVTAPKTDQVLFLLADGELVDIGWPSPRYGDPGAWYGQNLVRVKNGKIVEWWFSGYPTGKGRELNPWNDLNTVSNSRLVQ